MLRPQRRKAAVGVDDHGICRAARVSARPSGVGFIGVDQMRDQAGLREVAQTQIIRIIDEEVLQPRLGANVLAVNAETAILLVKRQAITLIAVTGRIDVRVRVGVFRLLASEALLPPVGNMVAVVIFRNGEVVFFSALDVGGDFALIVVENGCGREMAVGAQS